MALGDTEQRRHFLVRLLLEVAPLDDLTVALRQRLQRRAHLLTDLPLHRVSRGCAARDGELLDRSRSGVRRRRHLAAGVALLGAVETVPVLQLVHGSLLQPLDELGFAAVLEALVAQTLEHLAAHGLSQIGDGLLVAHKGPGMASQVLLETGQEPREQGFDGRCVAVAGVGHGLLQIVGHATHCNRALVAPLADSAPHARNRKEADRGCAGIFTANAGIELYAEAFEQAGALDRLEAFASERGPAFYGLPRNQDRITLERSSWTVPADLPFGDQRLVPMRAGEVMPWRLVESTR